MKFKSPKQKAAERRAADEPPSAEESGLLTPDGRFVPQALAEAALRQQTAVLIGGLLVGVWPERL